jgi:hypothetical protein
VPRPFAAIAALTLALGLPACDGSKTTGATAALAIDCAAIPPSGPAPLSVAFGLDVKNAAGSFGVSLSYGDGASGTDPDARHVYSAAGSYVASITVTAGTETARCSLPIAVAAAPAPSPSPDAENHWPDPFFRTNPPAVNGAITGKAPLFVRFNLCQSQDQDGDGLFYRFDLDGDGTYEFVGTTGGDCSKEITYPIGTRTASVCVTDGYCPAWPLCPDLPRFRFHPYQCESYVVTATP